MAFAVFSFDVRWPDGGGNDLVDIVATRAEADALATRAWDQLLGDAVHIMDLDTKRIVFERVNVERPKRAPRPLDALR